ncbi:FecCD family ABC transporter permease [Planosporangium sp. 12N6]|uniref:FecCD family ABC transporter permease n=1 Tax=Planosporangium spinosum TaxID=3402278 RepID=UPI003CECB74B
MGPAHRRPAARRGRRGGQGPRGVTGRVRWVLAGVGAVGAATLAGLALGPLRLSPVDVGLELLHLHSGLTPREAAVVTELRLPRVVLALLVGATLALAGGCYQGVFRNPLADPYLLGVAAGAGLGATAVIGFTHRSGAAGVSLAVPPAAFAGALAAVALTYLLGAAGNRYRTPATLILAGVAVSAFLTAGQTYLQQRNADAIREVYSWILGRLATAGWHDVLMMLPYVAVSAAVIIAHGRSLDVLALGDEEAASLGAHPKRTRYLLIVAASLGTAAAVAVSGLIAFVGIIVPHTVRLLVGSSYRAILPLSALFGGAFLAFADLAARLVLAPAEVPIGVVTAFFGAPFFIVVMRTVRRSV